MRSGPRHIWLCADDYGISPGVNAGIRELIVRGRINATSIMVASPYFNNDEAAALDTLNSGEKRADLGLHVTLTAPFSPMSADFSPLRKGHFLSLNDVLRGAVARRLQSELLITEIATQLRAFIEVFGRAPDFVDGHQHVHLFPQIRDALLRVVAQGAPEAWVRQCARAKSGRRLQDRKALTLDILSFGFRRKAKRLGIQFNPGFAGTYSFNSRSELRKDFPAVPDGLTGRWSRHVSSGFRRRCAKKPRFADDSPSATNFLSSVPTLFQSFWPNTVSSLAALLAKATALPR